MRTTQTKKPPVLPETEANQLNRLQHFRPVLTLAVGLFVFLALSVTLIATNRLLTQSTTKQSTSGKKLADRAPDTWTTFTDANTGLSFKYPEGWHINARPVGNDSFISLSPDKSNPKEISVYVSRENYFGFDGLKQTPTVINGYNAVQVGNGLYGFHINNTYYTFDAGLKPDATPVFDSLLNTIQFK